MIIEITFSELSAGINPAWIGIIGVVAGAIVGFAGQFIITRRSEVMQLRLASLDKRLESHQSAFAVWTEMVSTLHKYPEHQGVQERFDEWWLNNSIYLAPDTRMEMLRCRNEYDLYEIYWNDWRAENKGITGEAYKTMKKAWVQINQTGKKILSGINQPILDSEFKTSEDFDKSIN